MAEQQGANPSLVAKQQIACAWLQASLLCWQMYLGGANLNDLKHRPNNYPLQIIRNSVLEFSPWSSHTWQV